jgi:hypothetical protein
MKTKCFQIIQEQTAKLQFTITFSLLRDWLTGNGKYQMHHNYLFIFRIQIKNINHERSK